MNDLECALLNLLQHEFPLEKQPYASIASRLGISPEACTALLRSLQKRGILREIRPVINWNNVGYTGVLIGLTVDPAQVDPVAAAINTLHGVTHNYLREGTINLWCTLTYGSDDEKDHRVTFMRALPGVKDLKTFYSEKTYKIGLLLDLAPEGDRHRGFYADSRSSGGFQTRPYGARPNTEALLQHILVLQEPLPFSEYPFSHYAQRLGITEDEVIDLLRHYRANGTIRRVAGVLKHDRAGYTVNAMVAFGLEPLRCDDAGAALARFPFITHCYRRTAYPDWPYSLYAMVHARSQREFDTRLGEIRSVVSCQSIAVLRSVREYKKTTFRLQG